ncbi:hypothetical protein [Paraburkholderia bannensis]|nr:hypothetical protein [Paraburkholderia bannensis]
MPATEQQLRGTLLLLSFTAGASLMGVAVLAFLMCTRGIACF